VFDLGSHKVHPSKNAERQIVCRIFSNYLDNVPREMANLKLLQFVLMIMTYEDLCVNRLTQKIMPFDFARKKHFIRLR
jgi:hypothetical protein